MISRQAVLEVALCFAGRELTDGKNKRADKKQEEIL